MQNRRAYAQGLYTIYAFALCSDFASHTEATPKVHRQPAPTHNCDEPMREPVQARGGDENRGPGARFSQAEGANKVWLEKLCRFGRNRPLPGYSRCCK